MIIGEAGAVTELWEAARGMFPEPREDRPGQPVYAIDEPPPAGGTGLRAATPHDLELLVPACAAAHELELGIDPLARDPDSFRWRTSAQIEEGRSWVWVEDGVVLFKAEASAWTPQAVQIQQVWVDPQARGRGYGTRGLRDLCRLLLGRRRPSRCSSAARTRRRSRSTRRSACARRSNTAAFCFEPQACSNDRLELLERIEATSAATS